jgi:hypothetical protein
MSLFNYITYMTKYHWLLIDTHFRHTAGSISLLICLIKAANSLFKTVCNNLQLRVPMMQIQKLLTLRWRSQSWWGAEYAYIFSEYKVANTRIMSNNINIKFYSPDVQHLSLFTLCWCLFYHRRIHNVQSFTLAQFIIHNDLAAIQMSSCTSSVITTLFFNYTYKYIV